MTGRQRDLIRQQVDRLARERLARGAGRWCSGCGNDPGAGVEAAILGERHAEHHGRTWSEFLAAPRQGEEEA
jgi:hypothetical protein